MPHVKTAEFVSALQKVIEGMEHFVIGESEVLSVPKDRIDSLLSSTKQILLYNDGAASRDAIEHLAEGVLKLKTIASGKSESEIFGEYKYNPTKHPDYIPEYHRYFQLYPVVYLLVNASDGLISYRRGEDNLFGLHQNGKSSQTKMLNALEEILVSRGVGEATQTELLRRQVNKVNRLR